MKPSSPAWFTIPSLHDINAAAPRRRHAGLRWKFSGLTIFIFLAAIRAAAQCVPQTPLLTGAAPRVHLVNITLARAAAAHVSFNLRLSVRMPRALHLRDLRFAGLRINGLPVFAAPLHGDWQVPSRSSWPAPLLPVRLYYRDGLAMRSMQASVAHRQARVSGRIEFFVIPNALVRIFISRAPVAANFSQTVPVDLPGPQGVWNASALLLGGANQLLSRLAPPLETQWNELSQWGSQLQRQAVPRLLWAYARFQVRNQSGTTGYTCRSLGWRVSRRRLLLPAALLQPWHAQPDLAAALHTHFVRLVPGSYQLWVWPAGARWRHHGHLDHASALGLASGGVQIVYLPKPRRQAIYTLKPGGQGAVHIHLWRRGGARALALLRLPSRLPAAWSVPWPAALPAAASFPARRFLLALFRMPRGAGFRRVTPELLIVPAQATTSSLRLRHAMDDSAWGSALFTRSGWAGILQSSRQGVAWPRLKKFLTPSPQP